MACWRNRVKVIFTGYKYKIIISTSGRFAGGTDARVFIKFIGTNGESEEIELKDETIGKRLFEAGRFGGHFSYFKLNARD